MKKETRGRKCTITAQLTERIIEFIRQGCDQATACSLADLPYRTFKDWKARGQNCEEPYVEFFSALSRARNEHKCLLIKLVMAGARGLLPRPADWKAASWLLSKGWPLEFGDWRPLPPPVPAEPQPVHDLSRSLPILVTLPDGTSVDAAEALRAFTSFPRRCSQCSKPLDRPADHEHEHDHDTEPEIAEPVPPFNRLGRKFTLPNGG
jgi:hypothetical protein